MKTTNTTNKISNKKQVFPSQLALKQCLVAPETPEVQDTYSKDQTPIDLQIIATRFIDSISMTLLPSNPKSWRSIGSGLEFSYGC